MRCSLAKTALGAALSLVLLSGCGEGATGLDGPDRSFDRSALLANMADNIIVPAYQALHESVAALEEATSAFTASPEAGRLQALQSSLHAARLAWQDANLFEFGPAESQALRATLNTYPADTARVEANVVSGSYSLASIANRAAAGFPALDYLLHADEPSVTVEAFQSEPGRRQYLADNAAFIRSAVESTLQGWTSGATTYRATFLSQARGGTDAGSSFSMLTNALIKHYERFLRDGKIGIPAGVRSAGVPRPAATEALYAGYSAQLALANMEAVQRVFLGNALGGGAGTGFDDYLAAADAEALSLEIQSATGESLSALAGLQDPLSELVRQNPQPAVDAFTRMQRVVVLLKVDMTSILGVTITFQDNDGD